MQTIFNNNADVEELRDPPELTSLSSRPTSSPPDGAVENLTSPYDSIVYLGITFTFVFSHWH